MSTLIESPYPSYFDTDGKPLENGYIYIGVAGLNPLSNPLQAYWDADLTIPAYNIRTLGGYPIRGGTPARLYVQSNYSILIKNKHGRLVYSNLNAIDYFNDVSATTIQRVKTVSDLRNLNGYLAGQAVQVMGYYSVGDLGGGPVRRWDQGKPAGTYVDNGGDIIVPTGGNGSSAWIWEYSGICSVLWYGVKGNGTDDDTSVFDNALNSGNKIMIPEGINIRYEQTADLPSNLRLYGPGKISLVDDGTASGRSFKATGKTNIIIEDVEITCIGYAGRTQVVGLMYYKQCTNCHLKNVRVHDGPGQGILFLLSTECTTTGHTVYNMEADGIHVSRESKNCSVTNGTVYNCKDDHISIVSYGESEGVPISYCENIIVSGNNIGPNDTNGSGITVIGGQDITISGNTIKESAATGIKVEDDQAVNVDSHYNKRINIYGNTIESPGQVVGTGAQHGILFKNCRQVNIFGNTIYNSPSYGIYGNGVVVDVSIENNNISNSGIRGLFIDGGTSVAAKLILELFTEYGDLGVVTATCQRVSANSNKIYDSEKEAAYIKSTAEINVNGNIIRGVGTPASNAAIEILTCNNGNCNNNQVTITGALNGIKIDGSEYLNANGNQVISATGTAITFQGISKYCSAFGNNIFVTGNYGISEAATCVGNVIGLNFVIGALTTSVLTLPLNTGSAAMFINAGVLKYLGPANTLTNIAPA